MQNLPFFPIFLWWLIGTQADGGSASGDFGNQMKNEMGGMSLNTGYGARMEAKGFIEEVFIHEGAHASLDGYHVNVGLFSMVSIVWLYVNQVKYIQVWL